MSPQQVADRDSCFVQVGETLIHYKERVADASTSTSKAAQEGPADAHGVPQARSVPKAHSGNGVPPQKLFSNGAPHGAAAGAGHGPSGLLLLHGLNGSTFSWRLLLDDLAAYTTPFRGSKVVAFDRPPYGLSGRPLQWEDPDDNPYTNEGGEAAQRASVQARLNTQPPGNAA